MSRRVSPEAFHDPHSLLGLIDRMAESELVVVGDLVLDAWLSGEASRLCREGPVPVVDVSQESFAAGGAGNAAANAAALGAKVSMVGAVGDDADGDEVLRVLSQHGVDVSAVLRVPGRRTPAKRRLVCDGQLLARFDTARPEAPPEHVERRVAEALVESLARADGLLVSDYGLGTLGATSRRALRRREPHAPPLVVDSHDLTSWTPAAPDAVTPNWAEACRMISRLPDGLSRPDAVASAEQELLAAAGACLVAVTLDEDGAMLIEDGRPHHRAYARRVAGPSNTGAGDCFAAAFTLALAGGTDATAALEFGVAASGVVASLPRTGLCDPVRLRTELAGPSDVVVAAEELTRLVAGYRGAGKRIVFTNGCFDVLHRGHVSYLNEARRLGDVLIVALNDDTSVARLKGPDRPVNPARDRAAVLAALSCVDHVVIFSGDSPRRLLRTVRPDLYAKGGDYTEDALPEAELVRDLGAEIRILDYLADHSTSGIVSRIRGDRPDSRQPSVGAG